MPPTLFAAIRLGLRALVREPWLLAAGMGVAIVRRAAIFPALAVAWAVLVRGALEAIALRPFDPTAPVRGGLAAIGSPRLVALLAALFLAGLAVGAALRVAYLAGALPTLAGAMAGAPGPRFAAGVAFGFPRVLATAALGLVLDASGALFGGTLAVAAWRISVAVSAGGGSPHVGAPRVVLAAAVALALTLAVAVPLALSTVADAAVARAAIRAEGPAHAVAAGAGRFLARPGTFLLAALSFGAAALVAPGIVGGAGGLFTGFAAGAQPLLLLGPQLMVGTVALAVAAAVDLAWLGTVAALACGEG